MELLLEFHKKHNLPSLDSTTAPPLEETMLLEPRRSTLDSLEALFNAQNLEAEFQALRALRNKADSGRSWKKSAYNLQSRPMSKSVGDFITRNEVNNLYEEYLQYAPVNSEHRPIWDSKLAEMGWARVLAAVRDLPVLLEEQVKFKVLNTMTQWETCRALVAMFDWYTVDSRPFADALMETHEKGGYNALCKVYPRFAQLAEHAVQYVTARRRAFSKAEVDDASLKANTGLGNLRRHGLTAEYPDPPPGFPIDNVKSLPNHLYNLVVVRSDKFFTVPDEDHKVGNGHNSLKTSEAFYAFAAKVLRQWMGLYVIAESNRDIDAFYNRSRRSQAKLAMTRDAILARCIARGGTIKAIWRIVGHEGISVANHMSGIIATPGIVYGDQYVRNDRLASSLEKDFDKTCAPLLATLTELMSPEIGMISEKMAHWTHHHVLELYHGGPISESQFMNLDLMMDEGDIPLINLPREIRLKAKIGRAKRLEPVTRDRLMGEEASASVSALALIVREALNDQRGLPFASEYLSRVLQGLHATTASPQYDRDQTDPVRGKNRNITRLRSKLPGSALTTKTGLSSLLAWMSTGQGSDKTLAFINGLETFLFEDAAACVAAFEAVIAANGAAVEAAGHWGKESSHNIDGFRAFDNPTIYGAASNYLKAMYTTGTWPNKQQVTLWDKFSPFFEIYIIERWQDFLGPLYGVDPSEYRGNKRTWTQGLEFLIGLNLPGFKAGLTLLQTAHNLTYLSITSPPDDDRITDWIGSNPRLGAYRGLAALGFNLVDVGYLQVAFRVVYDHFDQFLSTEDKATLDFGAIFVEQLLCKIVRWDSRLRLGGVGKSLSDLAEEVSNHADHDLQGKHMQFP